MVHGVRMAEDLGYREELEAAAEKNSRIIYVPMCSREPEGSNWSGLRGRVTELFENSAKFKEVVGLEMNPDQSQMFLCGNPAMIDQVQKELETKGFKKHSKKNPGNLHFERYW